MFGVPLREITGWIRRRRSARRTIRGSYALSAQYGVGATTGVAWAAADRRNAVDEREGLVTAPSDLRDSAWWPTPRTGAWTLAAVRCLGSRCEDVAGGDG